MNCDYLNFIRILENKSAGAPSLFEPFICDYNCEELIWRRGHTLWDSPKRYIDTMLSVRERTGADIIFLDSERFDIEELLYTAEQIMPEKIKAAIICRNKDQIETAEKSNLICAVCGIGNQTKPMKKHFIRMDGDIKSAIDEGASAYFVNENIEEIYEKHNNEIVVLGGLGINWLNNSNPRDIYNRIENIFALSKNKGIAIGSGNTGERIDYLNMISMLGIYIRYK